MSIKEFDVVIVGAGLSGISAAYYLKKNCPNKTFTIFERRKQIGGTWDLFRYTCVRSDSDMFTLGYSFKPCQNDNSISPGDVIRNYVEATDKLRRRYLTVCLEAVSKLPISYLEAPYKSPRSHLQGIEKPRKSNLEDA